MKSSENRFLSFFRKNALYLILAFCILAIGVSVAVMAINKSNSINNELETPGPVIEDPSTPTDDIINPDIPSEPTTNPNENPTPDVPVVEEIKFIMPVENVISITEFSDTLVFNSTLNRYSAHLATDFYVNEGASVFAVYGGTVESVNNDLLKGVSVTIDHGNGLKTVYNSLSEEVAVIEGQKVNKGDILGSVGLTNRQEYKAGAHLHFEVLEDGVSINPSVYLSISEK